MGIAARRRTSGPSSHERRRAERVQPRRGLSFGGHVERAGHVVLTSIWTACVWVLRRLLRYGARLVVFGFTRFRRQRPLTQMATVAFLAGGSLAAAHVISSRPEPIPFFPAPPAPYVDDEIEALARVIRSEAGTGSSPQRIHVAWATRNLATERRQTVAQMACAPCGPQELGRPVSSRQDATDPDRELARHILASPAILDPTGGATHFINPTLQDDLAARGRPGYRGRPYQEVRARWIQTYGWEPYYRLGPDLEVWGPKRVRHTRSGKPRSPRARSQ